MNNRFGRCSIALIITLLCLCGCSKTDSGTDPGIAPPLVISVTPPDSAQDIPIDAVVTVTFSRTIDSSTLDSGSFFLDGSVVGTISYANKVATLTPNQNLEYNKIYNATVTNAVTDELAVPLSGTKKWSFRTTAGLIMPLAVGNWWAYQQNIYDLPGGTPGPPTYDTIRIVSATVIASETWYIDNLGNVMTNRADGLWKISNLNQMYLYLKFPASLNDAYTGNPDSGQTMQVTSLGVTVTTQTGLYFCHEYSELYTIQPEIGILSYYKPTLGLISWESYDIQLPDSGITKTRQLIHFNIQ